MSKLLKLLDWVTVPQAVRHLSVILDEEISEADILRLALDGKITLSVNFVNHTHARRGKIIPLSEARSVPGIPIPGVDAHNVVLGIVLPDGERVLDLERNVVILSGVWDLAMIGAESLDIEHKFQQLTGGPEVTLVSIEGAFVQRGGDLCELQEHFDDNEHFSKDRLKTPWSHPDNFYPAGGLPKDAALVIRTDELASFQSKLGLAQGMKQEGIEQLPPRAEATYLTIIGTMLELMLAKSAAGRAHSIFTSQASIIDALIAHNPNSPGIAKSTLEGKFAEARRRLHST